jgi:lipid A 3-O-deacylase
LAPDQFGLSVGWAHDIDAYGVELVWGLPVAWEVLERNDLTTRLSAGVSYWDGREQGAPVTSLVDLSATPLLRWSPPSGSAARVFAEAGIGVHVLSHAQINYKHFSTAVQFGERAALGLAVGPRDRFEIAGYVQHVSNAGIKVPNDGVTLGGVTLRLLLD